MINYHALFINVKFVMGSVMFNYDLSRFGIIHNTQRDSPIARQTSSLYQLLLSPHLLFYLFTNKDQISSVEHMRK